MPDDKVTELRECPVTHAFQPFDRAYASDPYPFYKEIAKHTPVAYSPEFDVWVVSRFADIVTVLKDRDTYSAANASKPFCPVGPAVQEILDKGYGRVPTFSNCDAPRHPVIRKAAMKCLNPKRWAKTEARLRPFVDELFKRAVANAESGVINIADEIIYPLTSTAGFTLIGFPPEDHEMLLNWCGNRVQFTYGELDEAAQISAAQDMLDFWNYCKEFVHTQNENREGDLTSDFLRLTDGKDATITVDDVFSVVFSLALASHETTANAILGGLVQLLQRRNLWGRLLADRDLIPKAVEELLRFESPTVGQRRITTCDTVLAGVSIPKGSTIVLLNASGNRDPGEFDDPDTIDFDRPNSGQHLAFGKKWHFCLGSPLARFEYGLVLENLLEWFPDMALVEDQDIPYSRVLLMRGPERLLVQLNASEAGNTQSKS